MSNIKYRLVFTDRIGIVFDIARLMTDKRCSIVAMEVEQTAGRAIISLEIDGGDDESRKDSLGGLFRKLPGLLELHTVQTLPREQREQWLRTVFEGMSEGVISVDTEGVINTINGVACRILGKSQDELVGKHITDVNSKDSLLLDCLLRKTTVSRRKALVTETGRVEFYGSARPIVDEDGNMAGAVLLMKDLKEVKEMVDIVSTPLAVTFDDFLGLSPAIANLITFARKIADTGTIVAIVGESGTGKELFARAIHFESGRTGPFIPVNCAALPESLIESELFGYVEGAFTGARRAGKPGLFEAAADGTIFLDEIGDMPPGPQAKILRVLQDGLVRRIGGFEEIPVNARIITATNKNLQDMVSEGRFREDLYYRINVLNIQIPPLRERTMDVPLLAGHFLHQFNLKLDKTEQFLSQAAFLKLQNHNWPGNVRELKNVIERAAVLSDREDIGADFILLNPHSGGPHPAPLAAGGSVDRSLKELVGRYEREILLQTLNKAKSVREASRLLVLSHTALLKKIAKYKIQCGSKTHRWN